MVSTSDGKQTAPRIALCCRLGNAMILANGRILAISCCSSIFNSLSSAGMGTSATMCATAFFLGGCHNCGRSTLAFFVLEITKSCAFPVTNMDTFPCQASSNNMTISNTCCSV